MDITNERQNGRWFTVYGVDTLIVLLFLTMEFGRRLDFFSLDGALMAVTMAMVAVLPYFLPLSAVPAAFGRWMAMRFGVSLVGLTFGFYLRSGAGGEASSLPMTLLIVAGMVSCYLQFYGLMKLRLAK